MAAADDTGRENVDLDIDVAIVGAGPGGLATAAAILSAFGKYTRVKVRPCSNIGAGPKRAPRQVVTACVMVSDQITHIPLLLQVYESMKEYKLQGSAVGLGPNAQHALEAIHPDLLARCSAL